mmetsp:Transcript_39544/g.99035  ORF Transcript_39544/g.99035 Transcript_39544/m.99035 type:complete len:247 (-) Transcript_39544:852-1592(-)
MQLAFQPRRRGHACVSSSIATCGCTCATRVDERIELNTWPCSQHIHSDATNVRVKSDRRENPPHRQIDRHVLIKTCTCMAARTSQLKHSLYTQTDRWADTPSHISSCSSHCWLTLRRWLLKGKWERVVWRNALLLHLDLTLLLDGGSPLLLVLVPLPLEPKLEQMTLVVYPEEGDWPRVDLQLLDEGGLVVPEQDVLLDVLRQWRLPLAPVHSALPFQHVEQHNVGLDQSPLQIALADDLPPHPSP